MSGSQVLVAGIGNIFLRDDGFGIAVVGRIDPSCLPEGIKVADYGIRGVHLAYDLLDGGYDTLVLVDAVPGGEDPPGTLAVLRVDQQSPSDSVVDSVTVDAHSMSPDVVLGVLRSLGGHVARILVVGCQPGLVEEGIGLSPAVEAAVDEAVRLVTEVVTAEIARSSDTGAVEVG